MRHALGNQNIKNASEKFRLKIKPLTIVFD